jgi:dimethylhistidine N-methyltransferase
MRASTVELHDLHPAETSLRDEVLEGLSRTPKTLPCKLFYDERGSILFDEITRLPEYYPTRTETRILRNSAEEIAELIGPGAEILELGSGSSVKIRLLLAALEAPAAYVPIDISREHLRRSAGALAEEFPGLRVVAVCADYTEPLELPDLGEGRRVAFFPGSTIGNFEPDDAERFLRRIAHLVGRGGGLVIGVDLKKDRATLERAYDDAAGVTAAFNLNILEHINGALDGDFDLARFRHVALWNDTKGRIEMHLESRVAHRVTVAGQRFRFAAGERIHTENSYKYETGEFHRLAARAGFTARRTWTDRDGLFSVHFLEAS